MNRPLVVKVGGSLYDLPDLRERLTSWLDQQSGRPILLVPGGGAAADVVRKLDEIHRLGDEKCHWLAIRAMGLGAWFLGAIGGWNVVGGDAAELGERVNPACPSVLDPMTFCQADSKLAHSWRTTSDSIAARVAISWNADLVLLKSLDLPPCITWRQAAKTGLVDDVFPELIADSNLNVQWVNLRSRNTQG